MHNKTVIRVYTSASKHAVISGHKYLLDSPFHNSDIRIYTLRFVINCLLRLHGPSLQKYPASDSFHYF